MCPSCRRPDQFGGDTYLKEQKLWEENGQLREQVCIIGAVSCVLHCNLVKLKFMLCNYLVKYVLQLKRYENIVANYKPLMVDVSRNAMDELIKLVQSDSPFWIRSSADGREVLNLECYESIFPGVAKSPNVRIESSKDSSVVIIDSLELVDMFMDARMVKTFCSSINTVNGQQVMISGMNDLEVRAILQRCTDPGHPNSIVVSAATTISVPFASVEVFNFFRDGRNRPLWDVFSNHNPVKEIGHIACGSHPGNRISVLGASGTSQSNMLILQESCIDSSGALVVYCPIDPHAINIAMSSEDPSVVPILSSGFAIAPDAGENLGPGEMSAGSLVTIVVQIIVSNLTTGTMSQEAVNTINHLVGNTIRQIKAALNCSTC
ncbi:homeobox-leucine zipper protein HDG11-like isoform X1 [Apium graveolens]|uniref:homeobox-leucine zipper protein HDG11-like isoform X1 n=1 Tax=Apium graveolens TaxID=4045 RepID=UPI003D7B9E3E